jgi:hypothetical protein
VYDETGRGACRPGHGIQGKEPVVQIHVTRKQIDRFWRLVNRTDDPDGCWEYTGQRDKYGYGRIGIFYKEYFAHRIAYMASKGNIPEGMKILHTCDNPPCCNPRHLKPGTQADNIRDAAQKGRLVIPNPIRGQDHPYTNLTDDQVIEMRRIHAEGGITYVELGKMFGITTSSARYIVIRKRWAHI